MDDLGRARAEIDAASISCGPWCKRLEAIQAAASLIPTFTAVRSWLLSVLAIGASAFGATPAAGATGFLVRACDAAEDAVNNSWSVVTNPSMPSTEHAFACPSSLPDPESNVAQGLAVVDLLAGPDEIPDGRFREWRFSAPEGLIVAGFQVSRDIGNRATLAGGAFTPYGRAGGIDLAGETCFRPEGSLYCRIQGTRTESTDAKSIAWGVRCASAAFCDGGFTRHSVWVAIRSAIVTIDDPVDPLISSPSGVLADASLWHRGTRGVTFEGADVTGIRQLGVYAGSTPVSVRTAPGSTAGGCGQLNQGIAYTFTKPCEGSRGLNGPREVLVDTAALGSGTRTLRLIARDAAGNEAESELVVKIDNEAPAAPVVVTDGAWAASETAEWSWNLPAEVDRAPIVSVDVELCAPDGSCETQTIDAPVEQFATAVGQGITTLRVRSRDAAGNVGEWSAAAAARRDRTPPVVTIRAPAEAVTGATVEPSVMATDALSGVAHTETQVRVDGGSWEQVGGPVTAPAGSTLRFRARATDQAGNVGPFAESNDTAVLAQTVAPVTPVVTPSPEPVAPIALRSTSKLHRLYATMRRGRLRISGRVTPAAATGRIRIAIRGRARHAKLRNGRFALSTRARVRARKRLALRYLGDAKHLPATRTVTIRRR